MGKFAAVYDLPGGQQLLVVLVKNGLDGPFVQYATEVGAHLVTAEIPLTDVAEKGDVLQRTAAIEAARNAIGIMDEETVKDIRRRFVSDLAAGNLDQSWREEPTCLQ